MCGSAYRVGGGYIQGGLHSEGLPLGGSCRGESALGGPAYGGGLYPLGSAYSGVYIQGGLLLRGGVCQKEGSTSVNFASEDRGLVEPPELEKRAVRVLLECFLDFFNFMQFLGKMAKIIGWRLSPGNFWIHHCNIYIWYLWLYLTILFISERRKLLLDCLHE